MLPHRRAKAMQKQIVRSSMMSARIAWFIALAILVWNVIVNSGLCVTHCCDFATTPRPSSLRKTQTERTPRLGDGCYHVFMDVGANIGVHGRFLFEPHMYPNSKISVPLFDKQYGQDRANQDYCVFAVEANPNRWPRLKNVSEAYAALGWRYDYVAAAAGDQDGTMVFHHQGDSKFNEWGFSVKKLAGDAVEGVSIVNVPSIRLTEWIQREILEREIPENPPSGRQYPKPVLGMKVDIEGSEYIVLPDLMLTGVFCQFEFVFGEVHPQFAPLNFTGQRVELNTHKSITMFQDAFQSVMKASRNCQVEFLVDIDDEAYLHDGVPFPDIK